jgi:uncharacterized protein VirK/YbjX
LRNTNAILRKSESFDLENNKQIMINMCLFQNNNKILMTNSSPFTPERLASINKVNFEYLVLLKDISLYCYPLKPIRAIRMFLRCFYFSSLTIAWFKYIANSPLLSKIIEVDLSLAEKLYRHNLRVDYPIHQRLKILTNHYSCIDKVLAPNFLEQVLLQNGMLLAIVTAQSESIYHLTLCYGINGSKEGELSIVMSGEDNRQLCRLSFSVIPTFQGHTFYIGGLQGANRESAQQCVNKACRDCYDLTPRRITMEVLWALAKHTGCSKILGVLNKQHISSRRPNKYFNYDEHWLSLNATMNEEGDFVLPLVHEHKELADVKRKRRAKYRKQRALLEIIHSDVLSELSKWNKI